MAATGYTPILIYASGTAAAVPLAADLTTNATTGAELAINYTDGKLYYKNNAGTVTLLASTSGASGDVVGPASATDNALARFDLTTGKLIQNSVGILSDAGILTGLTGLTSSGSITLSSLTSGRVTYAGTAGLLQDSANLTFDGTSLTLGGQILLSNNNYIGFKNTSSSVAASIFNDTSNFLNLYNSGNTGTIFYVNAGERLRLTNTSLYTASGVNVGIGTSNPTIPLDVYRSTFTSSTPFANQLLRVGSLGSGADASMVFSDSVANNGYIGIQGGYLNFASNTLTPQLKLDSSGNLGLGVTPSAFASGQVVLQNKGGYLGAGSTNELYLGQNVFYGGSPADDRYVNTDFATSFGQISGAFTWRTAASGTAGNAITFTQAMTLDASGQLSVGTTSAFARLTTSQSPGSAGQVNGQIAMTHAGATTAYFISTIRGASTNEPEGLTFKENATERMRITSAGLVGIGQNNPQDMLDVYANARVGQGQIAADSTVGILGIYGGVLSGSANAQLKFFGKSVSNTGVTYEIGRISSGSFGTYSIEGGLQFSTASNNGANVLTLTERMRLTSDGNLGLGTTAPATLFHMLKDGAGGSAPNQPELRIQHNDINGIGTGGSNGGILGFVNLQQNNTGWAANSIWGRINFSCSQPTSGAAQLGASILAAADGTLGGQQSKSYLAFYTSDGTNGGNNAEKMRITSGTAAELLVGTQSNYNSAALSVAGDLEARGNMKSYYSSRGGLAAGDSVNLFSIPNGSYGVAVSMIVYVQQRNDNAGNLSNYQFSITGWGGASANVVTSSTQAYGSGSSLSVSVTASSGSLIVILTNSSGSASTTMNMTALVLVGYSAITWGW
jgi:hypothetical protein